MARGSMRRLRGLAARGALTAALRRQCRPMPGLARNLVCASLVLITIPAAAARQQPASSLRGTWAATIGTKPALQGSWSAQLRAESPEAAAGTWTLFGANGKAAAQGTWSATRTAGTWSGTWSARGAGSDTLRSGTWRADVEHAPATFADLLRSTLETQVTGAWHSAGLQGRWALRATSTR
jgi:hypothetical protein